MVFDAADWRSPEEPEEGGRVYEIAPSRDRKLELHFGNGAVNFARIRPGDLLWRTHDPDLEKAVRPFTHPAAPVAKQPVRVRVNAHEGAPLVAEWVLVDQPDVCATAESQAPLAAAQNRAITNDLLRDQFGRLGATPYELADVELDISGRPFAPSSLLNQLRQQAVERLREQQALRRPVAIARSARCSHPNDARRAAVAGETACAAELHLLVRTPEQLDAALALKPASITLDYLDLYGLRPSVERVKAAGIVVRVASPRVLKPDEQRIQDFLLNLDCPILVRSAGLLDALRANDHPPLIGDFSLNAANVITMDLLRQLGLWRVTPTHDLNAAQVAELARGAGADRIEAMAYQHLPVFHTEHCVFCRFLSNGASYRDCGHPCETHRMSLRDLSGRAHPVMADVGCRNTVFGAQAQAAS